MKAAYFSSLNSYFESLASSRLSALIRAQDPLKNHPWVFAAAIVTAIVASQAPFVVFRETKDALEARRLRANAAGIEWRGARWGANRRAFQRYLDRRPTWRSLFLTKAAEPDWNSPFMDLLLRPNPFQTGNQLRQMTYIWLSVRGEAFWVLTDKEGRPMADPTEPPQRLWPIDPICFEPMHEHGTRGELVGWECRFPDYMPHEPGKTVRLSLNEVAHFKLPNPDDPLRGMSKLTALASTIESDLLVATHNRSLIENDAVPRCALEFEGDITPDERRDFEREWDETMRGPENAGKNTVLGGGVKVKPIGLSPAEMDFESMGLRNREAILAVMGTPPSILGISDIQNYATQLGQDRNFIEKNVVPLWKSVEETVDTSILFNVGEDVFAGHDLAQVEALRAGVAEKIDMAAKMCGDELHAPPEVAYQVVGLEVPEYEGRDVALVATGNLTFSDAIAPPEEEDTGSPAPDNASDVDDDEDDSAKSHEEGRNEQVEKAHRVAILRSKTSERWEEFVKIQSSEETKYTGVYRAWIASEKKSTLKRFDDQTKSRAKQDREDVRIDIFAILPTLNGLQSSLKSVVRPLYVDTTEITYELSIPDIGVPVFEIDNERIQVYFDRRMTSLLGKTPASLFQRLVKAWEKSTAEGETIQQLRLRIAEIFDISASSSKALTWARTESAGLMNGLRNEMFALQGFEAFQWTTANDEEVRNAHVTFGDAGEKPRGFDYMTLLEGRTDGHVRYPGDIEGPPDLIINCRCVHIPLG